MILFRWFFPSTGHVHTSLCARWLWQMFLVHHALSLWAWTPGTLIFTSPRLTSLVWIWTPTPSPSKWPLTAASLCSYVMIRGGMWSIFTVQKKKHVWIPLVSHINSKGILWGYQWILPPSYLFCFLTVLPCNNNHLLCFQKRWQEGSYVENLAQESLQASSQ